MAQTLALMAQPNDARLTRELAREVCQRTASAASIEGSISSLGSQYVVGLKSLCEDSMARDLWSQAANGFRLQFPFGTVAAASEHARDA